MKIKIRSKQIDFIIENLLNEIDYSLHIGDLPNDIKKYGGGTDKLFRMSGRSTGHFGSGTYFSTYKEENNELYKKYIEDKEYNNILHKVSDKIYVIDLDSYNLYKPKNAKNADFLFKTLKLINNFFYSLCSLGYTKSTYNGIDDDSKNKLKIIINNLNFLGLKLPPYKNFINLIKNICLVEENSMLPSLSTMIMEYNGYNGVNVNNINGWDNTYHGSVIYDLNKTEKPTKAKDVDTFSYEIKNDKIIKSFENNNLFYKNINKNTNILTINSLINQLSKPLENIDWVMLKDKLDNKEISQDIYNHIIKVYKLKLKKLINNGTINTDELTDNDIIFITEFGNLDYIEEKLNLESFFYKIYMKNLYKYDSVYNFMKSIDKNKISEDSYYNDIMEYI